MASKELLGMKVREGHASHLLKVSSVPLTGGWRGPYFILSVQDAMLTPLVEVVSLWGRCFY